MSLLKPVLMLDSFLKDTKQYINSTLSDEIAASKIPSMLLAFRIAIQYFSLIGEMQYFNGRAHLCVSGANVSRWGCFYRVERTV